MFEEHGALEHIGTLEVVPLHAHVVPIICKWVYKVKTKGDGSTKQYRAHFVAWGFQQSNECDHVTFALFAQMTTIRALIVVASIRSLNISQLEVENAFIHGDLYEEVYVQPIKVE